MNLIFATEEFRNECNNQERLVRKYGAERARLVRQRLDEFFNAEVLEDVRSLPHLALHAFPGNPSDLAVDVGAPYWLTFRSGASGKTPAIPRDWNKVDSIIILDIIKADEQSGPKPI